MLCSLGLVEDRRYEGGLVRVRGERRDMCEKIVGDEESLGRGWIEEEGEGKFEIGKVEGEGVRPTSENSEERAVAVATSNIDAMEKIFENCMMPVTESHETFVSAPKILRRRLTPRIKFNVNSKIAIEKYNIARESSRPPFRTTSSFCRNHLYLKYTYPAYLHHDPSATCGLPGTVTEAYHIMINHTFSKT
jgi:hypothetical protein